MKTIKGIWNLFKDICWANFEVLLWMVLINCITWFLWSSIGALVARYPEYIPLWYILIVVCSSITFVLTTVLGAESYVVYLYKWDAEQKKNGEEEP